MTLPVFLINAENKRALVQKFERIYIPWFQALEKEFSRIVHVPLTPNMDELSRTLSEAAFKVKKWNQT